MFKNEIIEHTNKYVAKLCTDANKSKLERMFEPKSYAQNNRGAYLGSLVLSYICNLISVLSAFAFLTLSLSALFFKTSPFYSYVISGALALCLVALIEYLKRNSLNVLIKDLFQYRKIRYELLFVAIITLSFSILTSYFGAQKLPKIAQREIVLQNVDSLQNAYLERIESAIILHTYKPTKTLTKKGAKIIESLENERIEAIKSANEHNEKLSERSENSTNRLAITLSLVAASLELLFLLSLMFVIYYQFRSYLELRAHQSTKTPLSTKNQLEALKTPKNEQRAHNVTARNIGFSNLAENERKCVNCDSVYLVNHKKQKFCSSGCRVKYHNESRAKRLNENRTTY
jgi:hypothetical protein